MHVAAKGTLSEDTVHWFVCVCLYVCLIVVNCSTLLVTVCVTAKGTLSEDTVRWFVCVSVCLIVDNCSTLLVAVCVTAKGTLSEDTVRWFLRQTGHKSYRHCLVDFYSTTNMS